MNGNNSYIKYVKKPICIFLVATLLFVASFSCTNVHAAKSDTKQSLDETNQTIEDLEKKQQENDEEKSQIKSDINSYTDKVNSFSEQLSEASANLASIETKLSDKKALISDTESRISELEENLATLKSESSAIYETMSDRIRYVYEQGRTGWISLLFSSENFADFINRIHYINTITKYDQDELARLKKITRQTVTTKEDISLNLRDLEADKAELEELETQYASKQNEMESLLSEAKSSLRASEANLTAAKEEGTKISDQLKEMEEKQAKLEAEYAKEEASRLAEIAEEESELTADTDEDSSTNKGVLSTDASDLELMTTIIYCEVRGESYKCQLAVGSVVANRVRSSKFPNTISGVIYQKGQFSPVASGTFEYYLANPGTDNYKSCRKAAKKILAGNTYNNFLYFRSNASARAAGITGTVIDETTFY